tara:strand:+ start:1232 stop:1480 length:249 start_codon:yes stop_codon:yes gene_type:complete
MTNSGDHNNDDLLARLDNATVCKSPPAGAWLHSLLVVEDELASECAEAIRALSDDNKKLRAKIAACGCTLRITHESSETDGI